MKACTQQDYHRRIAQVVEAILADPAAAHSVDSLAGVAHLSPFHFHRIYRAMTGEGVAETVRRLRLAQAAHHWLPRSGYDPDDRPALEFYRAPSHRGERADAVTALMIPIRKA